jgi:hypothetical protein
MKIYKLDLTKRKLAALSAEERRALLLLGHAINEINVLQKLILMHRRTPAPHKIVERLEAGQSLIFARILIGKLHEAWELFKVRVQAVSHLRSKYVIRSDTARCALLARLNKHFGGGSPLTAIRNRLSFHYTDKTNLVEDNFKHLSDTEPWEFYLAETMGNSFYWASELVTTAGMVRLATPDARGQPEDFGTLFDVATDVAADITELFQQIVADMAESIDVEAVPVEVGAPARLSTTSLPFLFDEDDLRRSAERIGT